MPIYSTSIEAIRELSSSGKLNQRQMQVYEALLSFGPSTGTELDTKLKMPNAHKRVSELKRMKYVDCIGSKECSVTGRRSMVWKARLDVPDFAVDYKVPPSEESSDSKADLKRKLTATQNKLEALKKENEQIKKANDVLRNQLSSLIDRNQKALKQQTFTFLMDV
jgi:hypothetical protein